MPALTPKISSQLARDIYLLVGSDSSQAGLREFNAQHGDFFNISVASLSPGKTGAFGVIKCKTVLGACLYGKGPLEGHAVFLFRGTHFTALDFLSNLDIGISQSYGGQRVHTGFLKAFESMQRKVAPFVDSLAKNKIHSVHCIGHSLGGALATMCADYIRDSSSYQPYVYTYGAPRVGPKSFADAFTSSIGAKKIFRVYNQTDIVPCIPFWPFVHAPTFLGDTYDYFQPSPGVFPSISSHCRYAYADNIAKAGSWSAARNQRCVPLDEASVMQWLKKQGPVNFCFTDLEFLDKAINLILQKSMKHLGSVATIAFSGTFSVADRLAYILRRGIDVSKSMSGLILSLLGKILNILGMSRVVKAADATRNTIRDILLKLYKRISLECKRILDQVFIGGRQVY